MRLIFLSLIVAILFFNLAHVNAVTITYSPESNFGTVTAADNTTLTKYLQLHNERSLSLIATANITFTLGYMNVSTSDDNSTFQNVDVVNITGTTIKGVHYSDAVKATTVTVNPAMSPYLKIEINHPVNGTASLTWSAGNDATIS